MSEYNMPEGAHDHQHETGHTEDPPDSESLETRILARYTGLFPNYAWTDAQTAIDLMEAEIKTLRIELQEDKAITYESDAANTACLSHLRTILGRRDVHGIVEGVERIDRALLATELCAERARQDAQWGGPVHDDMHEFWQWIQMIREHTSIAERYGYLYKARPTSDYVTVRDGHIVNDADTYEHFLINVAALCIAAVQSHRRKRHA